MPNRLRMAAKFALILTLVAPLASAQNPNNNGPGGRNGGGPGGGGPGGGGPGGGRQGFGGGGGGTTPTALIVMPVIQEELKMTDKQKAQVVQINEEAGKKRTQVRENADKMAAVAREQAAMQAAAAAEANGRTNANAGGRGGQNGRNDAGREVVRQAMDTFQKQVETALLKVLDAKQKTRIKQIALQAEGAGAFDNPEVIEKLGLQQDQVAAIAAIRNDSRRSQFQLMGQLFNNGENQRGGQNGGNDRGGQRGGGRPDPATFQTPEFQAKLKDMQSGQQKLNDQTMVAVGKALTKAQRLTFNKMIGDKFDTNQLRPGITDRFRPAGAPGTPPGQQASAATPAPAPAPAATATPTQEVAKPAARKSLRDARGGSNP